MQQEKLVIQEQNFIGKGCHKLTYLHPHDAKKCIKIIYNQEGEKDIARELHYRQYRKEHNLQTDIIPAYYGTVATSKGMGYVFEYVCDYDGSVSKTLMDYVHDEPLFQQNLQDIIPLMQELKVKLMQDRIICMGITPENILIQQATPTTKKLYLITDLGVSEAIPLELWFDYFAVKKIKRHYQKMVQIFAERWPSDAMQELLAALK